MVTAAGWHWRKSKLIKCPLLSFVATFAQASMWVCRTVCQPWTLDQTNKQTNIMRDTICNHLTFNQTLNKQEWMQHQDIKCIFATVDYWLCKDNNWKSSFPPLFYYRTPLSLKHRLGSKIKGVRSVSYATKFYIPNCTMMSVYLVVSALFDNSLMKQENELLKSKFCQLWRGCKAIFKASYDANNHGG